MRCQPFKKKKEKERKSEKIGIRLYDESLYIL